MSNKVEVSFYEWCIKNNKKYLLDLWDDDKNHPITTKNVSYASNKKCFFKCENGHEWISSLNNQIKRKGCVYCAGRHLIKGENDFESWCKKNNNKKALDEWNYKKNDKKPSEVKITSHYEVWWVCSKCGYEWKSEVRNRVKYPNIGCSKCARPIAAENMYKTKLAQKGSLIDHFPNISKEWDYEKNINISPERLLPSSNKIVWWKCEKGHSYKTSVNHKTGRNSGCPICSNQKVLVGYNDLVTTNPEIAKEWDYSKNTISPLDITVGSNKKVWWICSTCGYSWNTTVVDRKQGRGCPQCNKESKSSFPEQAIFYYINNIYPDAILGDRHLVKELDVYIPSKKVAIEYDGGHWHKNLQKDIEKNELCKSKGIMLYRVRETNCPEMKSEEGIKILTLEYGDEKQLENIIKTLCIEISNEEIDVDLYRDKSIIYSKYLTKKKENSIASKHPELLDFWDYQKNGTIKPSAISFKSNKEFFWKCKNGHSYKQSVKAKVSNSGCPICTNHRIQKRYNDFETWCKNNNKIKLLDEWDYDRNTFLPSDIMMGTEINVWWKCKNGHSYESFPYTRKSGAGCPYCSVPAKKVLKGFNDLKHKYPELAMEWDYEKNGVLKPDDVTFGSGKKVWWKCSQGHSFQSQITTRVNGYGCPECGKKKVIRAVRNLDTMEVFESITIASQKKGISGSSISLCCKGKTKTAGGFRWEYYDNRPKNDLVSWCINNNKEYILNEWDIEANGFIKPKDVTYGSKKRIHWKCSNGHSWEAIVKNRTRINGNMCPICRKLEKR